MYSAEERAMTKAKLFTIGGSQAVRLPAVFRFEGSEVDIRRDPVTGEVVLSKPTRSWDDYFDWARTLDLPDDFLEKRDQRKDDLRDRLTHRCASVAEFLLGTDVASRVGLVEICRSPHAVRKCLDYSASTKGFIEFGTSRAYFLPNMSLYVALVWRCGQTGRKPRGFT